jgi:predicted MFS family arabinose efflux permease
MALGTFAVGTEGFMIAPLLPDIAADMSIEVHHAGYLVVVFALAYAISSPILTTLTARLNRRQLLIFCMAAFSVANLLAWSAWSYGALMAARILLAFIAGLYVPNANALASVIVPVAHRGRALAVINGGTTMALVLGVPLGQMIGYRFGWRLTFASVAVLAFLATVGLLLGLSSGIGSALPTVAWRDRLLVVRQPAVLRGLLVTALWATGAYVLYTYLAVYLKAATDIGDAHLGLVFLLWGVFAAIGVFCGGSLNDRFGARRVIIPALILLALSFFGLSAIGWLIPQGRAVLPVLLCIAVWGLSAWAFFPAQQARLIEIGGLQSAPIVLSLNASFMFFGFSLGAAVGSATLSLATSADLGWVGAAFEFAALIPLLAIRSERASPMYGSLQVHN